MAVPSSGELSLWGIAQEMIRNSYTAHQEISPATNNDNLVQSTSESDMLLVQAGPNSTYGYFAGGTQLVPNNNCTVNRLDFSTESLSAPGKNLSYRFGSSCC